jgi:hypothetical protein
VGEFAHLNVHRIYIKYIHCNLYVMHVLRMDIGMHVCMRACVCMYVCVRMHVCMSVCVRGMYLPRRCCPHTCETEESGVNVPFTYSLLSLLH